jgi:hypothetical protein
MIKPDWVLNEIKYNRAKAQAKHPEIEAEVKALYVSYGGKLAIEDLTPEVIETFAPPKGTGHAPVIEEEKAEVKAPAKRGRKAKVLAEDGAETLPEVG